MTARFRLLATSICHYDGIMEKTTLRIPAPLLEELRRRSRQEGRSINAVAVEALRLGLGNGVVNPDLHEILGPLIAKPATMVYSRARLDCTLGEASEQARGLWDAFEWTRGER